MRSITAPRKHRQANNPTAWAFSLTLPGRHLPLAIRPPARHFLLQRPGGETGSFGSIAGAETALTREFGRHVFEIAALLRVSQRLYNYRVWVVGVTGIEPILSPKSPPADLPKTVL